MSRFFGLALAGALVLGLASESSAQFGLSIGNPYSGTGINIGIPGAYGYGYPGAYSYSSGYGGYATPYVGGYGYPSYGVYRPIYGGGYYGRGYGGYGGYGRGYGGYGGYGRGFGGYGRGWRR